jgi:molybdenum cofactor biosynthesis enzyme MoaA
MNNIAPLGRSPQDKLGRPLRDLRISVMDRCNFRCPYCMPRERFHEHYAFLKTAERLSFEEILRLTRLFVPMGVRKLRITGGEPLLRVNLPDLIADLNAIPGVEDIALTTNGVLLAKHAYELKAAGLNRVTISLDSLDQEIFSRMNGGFGKVSEVLDGIEHARAAGLGPIKINAVIQQGVNDAGVLPNSFAARALPCASSSTWTWAIAMTGAKRWSYPRAICRHAFMRAGRCMPSSPTTLGKLRAATPSTMALAKSGSFLR